MRNNWENLAIVIEGEWKPANEFELVRNNEGEIEVLEEVDKNGEAWQSRIWWGRTSMAEQAEFWEKLLQKLKLWEQSSQSNKWAIEDAKNILRVQGTLSIYFKEDYRFYEKADFPEKPELVREINQGRKILMVMFGAYSFAKNQEGKLIYQQRKSGFWNKKVNEFIEFGENKPDKMDFE